MLLACACLFASVSEGAETPVERSEARLLPFEETLREPIEGGQKHYYRLSLTDGDFVQIEAEQQGANVGLTVRDAQGTLLFQGNSPNGARGPEMLPVVAPASGDFELEVWSLVPGAPEGHYTLRVATPRPASDEQRRLVEMRHRAWTLLESGFGLRRGARSADDMRAAIENFEACAPLWGEVGDLSQQARALNAAGLSYRQLGEPARTKPLYEKALALWRQAQNREGEADQLNNLGRLHSARGDLRAALATHEQALAIRRQIEDLRGVTESLGQLGAVLGPLGETDRAISVLQEALALAQQLGDRAGQAHTLNNLGLLVGSIDPQTAIQQFEQALELWREVGSRRYQAVTLSNLGTTYDWIGDYARSRQLFEEALRLNRELGDRNGEAAIQFNLGWSLYRDDEMAAALAAFETAHGIFVAVEDRRGQSRCLVALAATRLELGEVEAARQTAQSALTALAELGEMVGQWSAHQVLAEAQGRLGGATSAKEHLDRATALADLLRLPGLQAATLIERARQEAAKGRLEAAREHLLTAVELTESIRSNVASATHRTTFLAAKHDRYQLLTEVLMKLDAQAPGQGHAEAALANVERARARGLLELLAEADIRGEADPELLEAETSLRTRINALERRRLALLQSESPEQFAEAETVSRQVQRLLDQMVDTRARLRTSNPRFAALTEAGPAPIEEIQSQLLDDDTLLLEYALGDDVSYLWAVTPQSVTAYSLPARQVIEEKALRVAELLQAPGQIALRDPEARAEALADSARQLEAASRSLSALILGPVTSQLARNPRLIVAADGALQYLPFAVLPAPGGDQKHLVASHEVVHAPSASVLLRQRRELADRPAASKQLAVLADPVFRVEDPRVRRAEPSAAQQVADGALRDPAPAGGFPRLRFTRREAERLAAMVPPEERWVALSFEASRSTATDPRLGQYRIVHFATHGVLDSERPNLSGVVLSLVDSEGNETEGFLRLHDIYGLKLGAELVVLSACQTALGRQVRGEGLIGLTRGFMFAGAERVVASLWQVPDRASALLMERFYRAMLIDGLPAAAALRRAQVSMIEEGRFAHPHSWGAFVLQGDWR